MFARLSSRLIPITRQHIPQSFSSQKSPCSTQTLFYSSFPFSSSRQSYIQCSGQQTRRFGTRTAAPPDEPPKKKPSAKRVKSTAEPKPPTPQRAVRRTNVAATVQSKATFAAPEKPQSQRRSAPKTAVAKPKKVKQSEEPTVDDVVVTKSVVEKSDPKSIAIEVPVKKSPKTPKTPAALKTPATPKTPAKASSSSSSQKHLSSEAPPSVSHGTSTKDNALPRDNTPTNPATSDVQPPQSSPPQPSPPSDLPPFPSHPPDFPAGTSPRDLPLEQRYLLHIFKFETRVARIHRLLQKHPDPESRARYEPILEQLDLRIQRAKRLAQRAKHRLDKETKLAQLTNIEQMDRIERLEQLVHIDSHLRTGYQVYARELQLLQPHTPFKMFYKSWMELTPQQQEIYQNIARSAKKVKPTKNTKQQQQDGVNMQSMLGQDQHVLDEKIVSDASEKTHVVNKKRKKSSSASKQKDETGDV